MLRQGRSLLEVAKNLGHADATMALKVHGQATDTLRDAMASLDGFGRAS